MKTSSNMVLVGVSLRYLCQTWYEMSCADDLADRTVLEALRGLVLGVLIVVLGELVAGLAGVVRFVGVTCAGFLGILSTGGC